MSLSVKERVEIFFKLPFEEVIQRLHLKDKVSLNALSKKCGVSRQSITSVAKKSGLRVRTVKEATSLTKNKGKNHFRYGRTKETCADLKLQSENMKLNNPMKNRDSSKKRAISMQKVLKKRALPQEVSFSKILKTLNIKFVEQKPVDRYNLDFFIPEKNLVIEIDSTSKIGGDKRKSHRVRDFILLNEYGLSTIRIDKRLAESALSIFDILYANDIVLDKKLINSLPPSARKDWVLSGNVYRLSII